MSQTKRLTPAFAGTLRSRGSSLLSLDVVDFGVSGVLPSSGGFDEKVRIVSPAASWTLSTISSSSAGSSRR